MKALIDADILSYEISSCGQFKDELTGETITRDFDFVADLLDQKIREIVFESGADDFTLYLTGDPTLTKLINREAKYNGNDVRVFEPNFRVETAKTKPYKGTRKVDKPFHFHNIRAYMISHYDCIVTNGIEADDLICIHMTDDLKLTKEYGFTLNHSEVICCTRDKDLRMCPGWHYGWACGKQPIFGPELVDDLGKIELINNKIKGTGFSFFYSQLITGDVVDNIPGLPKRGPVFAYKLLNDARTESELFDRVKQAYIDVFGELWKEKLREQVDLLWMIRELNEDGSIKFYQFPEEENLSADQRVN